MRTSKPRHADYSCSFCGKSKERVQRLIAGPGGVYICNECVTLCNEIIAGEQPARSPQAERRVSDKGWRLLALVVAWGAFWAWRLWRHPRRAEAPAAEATD
jgi:hypothetical protein